MSIAGSGRPSPKELVLEAREALGHVIEVLADCRARIRELRDDYPDEPGGRISPRSNQTAEEEHELFVEAEMMIESIEGDLRSSLDDLGDRMIELYDLGELEAYRASRYPSGPDRRED